MTKKRPGPPPDKRHPGFPKGVSGNPKGKPKGTRDRATIVREILEAADRKTGKQMVDLMTEAVLRRATKRGDPLAFDKLMDSAYGKVKDVTKLEMEGVNVKREIADTVLKDPSVLAPLPGEPGHPDTKPDDKTS